MGGDLLARVIREAMASRGLDRRAVVDRLDVSARARSAWFVVLDRLRSGAGASAHQLERLVVAIGLDRTQVHAAVADDEGEELHRYQRWEAWAWEPTVPSTAFEVLSKYHGRTHAVVGATREAALAFARDLARRTGHPVWVPAFRSAAARLSVGAREHRFYMNLTVPYDEAVRFRLRRLSVRGEPPGISRPNGSGTPGGAPWTT